MAPSVLQHEVKNLSHNLLDKMVKQFVNLSGKCIARIGKVLRITIHIL